MFFADEFRLRRAPRQVPFAEKRRRVAAFAEPMGDRAALRRQRIVVVADAVLRREHTGEQRRAGERAERMRRHRLDEIDGLRPQRIEVRGARVGIARVAGS